MNVHIYTLNRCLYEPGHDLQCVVIISNGMSRNILEVHFSSPQGFVVSPTFKIYHWPPKAYRDAAIHGYDTARRDDTGHRDATVQVRYGIQGLQVTGTIPDTGTIQYAGTIQEAGQYSTQVRYGIQGLRYTGTIQDTVTIVHRDDTGYKNYSTQIRYRIQGLRYTGTQQYTVP